MGLDVVPGEPSKKEDDNMGTEHEVKKVTDVVRQVAEVGRKAERVNADLAASLAEIEAGLGAASEMGKVLQSAANELRGVLAPMTNNPPPDTTEEYEDRDVAVGAAGGNVGRG